jgi:hypothetical protein
MRHEAIVRAEAAVEMRDLAAKTVLECIGALTSDSQHERRMMRDVLEHAARRVQGLRLPNTVQPQWDPAER